MFQMCGQVSENMSHTLVVFTTCQRQHQFPCPLADDDVCETQVSDIWNIHCSYDDAASPNKHHVTGYRQIFHPTGPVFGVIHLTGFSLSIAA